VSMLTLTLSLSLAEAEEAEKACWACSLWGQTVEPWTSACKVPALCTSPLVSLSLPLPLPLPLPLAQPP
jgi:hypothetical protein